jgi:pSer/pThr/pTyr-binding forkhead associated (FHA) protein
MDVLELVPTTGAPIVLDRDRTLFGREVGCDVVVNDSSVSRRHAVVERHGERWLILDQQSANGTFVDGQRVIQAYLRAGQELRLGSIAFRVAVAAEAEESPTIPRAAVKSTTPSVARATAPPAASPAASPEPTPPANTTAQAEAAALLGVWPGAQPEEVLHRYQKLRDDLAGRLKHAPTPALKRMYQKNLQDLRQACETLLPGSTTP